MKGTTALKKITAEAKRLRKKSPGIAWASAIKKASAKFRASKKPVRKKAAPKKVAKKAVRRSVKKSAVKKASRPFSRPSVTKTLTVRKVQKLSGLKDISLSFLYDDLKRLENVRIALKQKMREVPKSEKKTVEKSIRYYNRLIGIQKRSIEMAKKI